MTMRLIHDQHDHIGGCLCCCHDCCESAGVPILFFPLPSRRRPHRYRHVLKINPLPAGTPAHLQTAERIVYITRIVYQFTPEPGAQLFIGAVPLDAPENVQPFETWEYFPRALFPSQPTT